ncbi:MAG: c-type cytochrome [Gemmatimonadota bacterium]|nr:c-type cytochrome [Gemmatimonadota bacterium]
MRAVFAALVCAWPGAATAQWLDVPVPARPEADPSAIEAGRIVYETHCWYCHGEEGDGAGPVASTLWPRPRDFTIASFKLRTTGSGELPTDEDLYRSITLGLAGTSMPAWGPVLTPAERWQVIAYLKTFGGGLFEDEAFDPYEAVVEVTPTPDLSEELIASGELVYERSDCWECHGFAGRGDGEKAPELEDDWGYPNRTTDLESSGTFRGGATARDVYLRLGTGLDGTPMPSYSESLTDEERWQVAHYVASLDLETRREAARSVAIVAARLDGPLPARADEQAWERAEEIWVPLTGQATFAPRWQVPSATDLSVRALHNDEEIALRLSWTDRSVDTLPGDPGVAHAEGWTSAATYPALFPDGQRARGSFVDRVEAMFPAGEAGGLVLPHFVYGDDRNPVDLWRWTATRDGDATSELTARGPQEPPETRPEGTTRLRGVGTHIEGRWTVVLRRPRIRGGPSDGGVLRSGEPTPIAFHVWDGSHGETGLRMALSQWYFLFLEERARPTDYLFVLLAIATVAGVELGTIAVARRRANGAEVPPAAETRPR